MMHVVCGTPRSGSTLLCNILNQNEALHASGTSPLVDIVTGLSASVSASREVQSMLISDPHAEERILGAMRAYIRTWYHDKDNKLVLDKGRAWATQLPLLRVLCPDSVAICLVRDPRDMFASVEKQHRGTAVFTDMTHNVVDRANAFFSPDGFTRVQHSWSRGPDAR